MAKLSGAFKPMPLTCHMPTKWWAAMPVVAPHTQHGRLRTQAR
jgi:hypothetical protein